MYPVSQEYISTIEKGGYETKIIGTITLKDETIIVINNSSLIKGTLYINSQCVDNSDFNIGAVYANELGLGLFGEDDFNRYDDAVIEMRFGITTSETTIEYVPLGIYTVIEPKRTGKFINLKALDNMILLDENLDGVGTSGTLFDLTTYCLERCGVIFGMTREELELYPNGKSYFNVPSDSPIETCRDLISYIAQLLGCFACCNRQGKLIYKPFIRQSVCEITGTYRTGTCVSDYFVNYNGVSMPIGENEYIRVDDQKIEGNTLMLESNPFLQNKTVEDIELALDNMLIPIETVTYMPFECDYTGNPAIDVGDYVTLSGGNINDSIISTITSSNWKYRGKHRLKSVGKNPKLKVKETQSQKRLNQTSATAYGSKETVYFFENSATKNIRDEDDSIIEIQFAAIKKASPMFHASIIFTIEAAGVLEFTLVINNTKFGFKPVFNVAEGDITIPIFMPLNNVQENKLHTFEVYLKSDTAKGFIAKQNIQAVVVGQGLSAGEGMWDGKIRLSTEITPFSFNDAITSLMAASPAFVTQVPDVNGMTENLQPMNFNGGLSFGGIETEIGFGYVTENALFYFDIAHKTDHTYNDSYYIEAGVDYIKVAEQYTFTAVDTAIDNGFMQVATVDSGKFTAVTESKVEVI